jgi:hypothetical protein
MMKSFGQCGKPNTCAIASVKGSCCISLYTLLAALMLRYACQSPNLTMAYLHLRDIVMSMQIQRDHIMTSCGLQGPKVVAGLVLHEASHTCCSVFNIVQPLSKDGGSIDKAP